MTSEPDVSALLDGAQNDSVTEKRLTKLKGGLTTRYLYDRPLIDYLKEGEQPHFILATRQKPPKFSGDDVPSWGRFDVDGMVMHMITDQRWVFVVGMKSGDEWYPIKFDDILHIECKTGTFSHEVKIETSEFSVEIPISNSNTGEEVQAAVKLIQNHTSKDLPDHPFNISLDSGVPTPDHSYFSTCRDCKADDAMWYTRNGERKLLKCESCGTTWRQMATTETWELYKLGDTSQLSLPKTMIRQSRKSATLIAKLLIPTRSTSSTIRIKNEPGVAQVEEDPWENYVKRLIIHEDNIEIKITHGDLSLTSDNKVHETIRVQYSDISEIRKQQIEGQPGFTFQTQNDTYQFKLSRFGKLNTAGDGDAQIIVKVLQTAVKRYEESVGSPPDKHNNGDDVAATDTEAADTEADSSNVAERLKQLKELHDDGVITDDEFQNKKSELLDEL